MSDTPQPIDWNGLTYGVCSPAELAGLSGADMMAKIASGDLPDPPICRQLTFRLAEVGEGIAVFEGDTGPHLLNPMGSVHGGWALTLIDSAAGVACQSVLPAGKLHTTIETKANFARPIRADTGRVRCEAQVVGKGRTVMSCEVRLTDRAGKLLAHGTSTIMVLDAGA